MPTTPPAPEGNPVPGSRHVTPKDMIGAVPSIRYACEGPRRVTAEFWLLQWSADGEAWEAWAGPWPDGERAAAEFEKARGARPGDRWRLVKLLLPAEVVSSHGPPAPPHGPPPPPPGATAEYQAHMTFDQYMARTMAEMGQIVGPDKEVVDWGYSAEQSWGRFCQEPGAGGGYHLHPGLGRVFVTWRARR